MSIPTATQPGRRRARPAPGHKTMSGPQQPAPISAAAFQQTASSPRSTASAELSPKLEFFMARSKRVVSAVRAFSQPAPEFCRSNESTATLPALPVRLDPNRHLDDHASPQFGMCRGGPEYVPVEDSDHGSSPVVPITATKRSARPPGGAAQRARLKGAGLVLGHLAAHAVFSPVAEAEADSESSAAMFPQNVSDAPVESTMDDARELRLVPQTVSGSEDGFDPRGQPVLSDEELWKHLHSPEHSPRGRAASAHNQLWHLLSQPPAPTAPAQSPRLDALRQELSSIESAGALRHVETISAAASARRKNVEDEEADARRHQAALQAVLDAAASTSVLLTSDVEEGRQANSPSPSGSENLVNHKGSNAAVLLERLLSSPAPTRRRPSVVIQAASSATPITAAMGSLPSATDKSPVAARALAHERRLSELLERQSPVQTKLRAISASTTDIQSQDQVSSHPQTVQQSPAVQAKLDALDNAYDAQAISSEQYYAARTRILTTSEAISAHTAVVTTDFLAPQTGESTVHSKNIRTTSLRPVDSDTRPTERLATKITKPTSPPPLLQSFPLRDHRSTVQVRYAALSKLSRNDDQAAAESQLQAAFVAAEEASPARRAAREADEKLQALFSSSSLPVTELPSIPTDDGATASEPANTVEHDTTAHSESKVQADAPSPPGRTIMETAAEAAASSSEARLAEMLRSADNRDKAKLGKSSQLPQTSSGLSLEPMLSSGEVSNSRLPISPASQIQDDPETVLDPSTGESADASGAASGLGRRMVPLPAWMERPGSSKPAKDSFVTLRPEQQSPFSPPIKADAFERPEQSAKFDNKDDGSRDQKSAPPEVELSESETSRVRTQSQGGSTSETGTLAADKPLSAHERLAMLLATKEGTEETADTLSADEDMLSANEKLAKLLANPPVVTVSSDVLDTGSLSGTPEAEMPMDDRATDDAGAFGIRSELDARSPPTEDAANPASSTNVSLGATTS